MSKRQEDDDEMPRVLEVRVPVVVSMRLDHVDYLRGFLHGSTWLLLLVALLRGLLHERHERRLLRELLISLVQCLKLLLSFRLLCLARELLWVVLKL